MKTLFGAARVFAFALIGVLLGAGGLLAQQINFPDYDNIYVNDFADVLTDADEARITKKLMSLREDTGIEFTVVTINQMREYGHSGEIEPFATKLFNHWGVGDKERNDGVMMLVAIKDRQMRIEVGSGYRSSMNGLMKYVIDNDILPYFKQGDYRQGIKDGVDAAIYRVRNPDEVIRRGNSSNRFEETGYYLADKYLFFLPGWAKTLVLVILTFAGLIVGAIGALFAGIYLPIKGVIYLVKKSTDIAQNLAPRCEKCRGPTRAASQQERMESLSKGQIAELECDSAIYKTWRCASCGHVTIKRFKRWFAKYKPCPQCEFATMNVGENIIEDATEDRAGLGEKLYNCMNCGYENIAQFTIPQVSRDRGSSSSSSSSSSFGGGSSSGGGASGRW